MPKQNEVTGEYKILLARIGENLALARRAKGMTQRDLAAKSEKNQALVGKLEKYPPIDMSMRSIYEIVRSIPVSFSEFVAKAERDIELEASPLPEPTERLKQLCQKFSDLSEDEQVWMADMVEGLLARTNTPPNRRDKVRKSNQAIAAQ